MAHWRWSRIAVPGREEHYCEHVENRERLAEYLQAVECLLQQCNVQADRLWFVSVRLVGMFEMDCLRKATLELDNKGIIGRFEHLSIYKTRSGLF